MLGISEKPTVALTLGDPAGIGPELMAKLLARRDVVERAKVVLVGDAWLWEQGRAIAGVSVSTRSVDGFDQVDSLPDGSPFFLPLESVGPSEVSRSTVSSRWRLGAQGSNYVPGRCVGGTNRRHLFCPSQQIVHENGGHAVPGRASLLRPPSQRQLHFGEFNTLGNLWTARISSHVPLKDVALYVTKERILDVVKLLYDALRLAGFEHPRIAVAALNPHAGEGGSCGREEIDIIGPAVSEANAEGYPVAGPFPADTIFLKARDGQYDGIVTMYHDQGQIAVKLLGFQRGVTIQGGLPIPITTSAHGSAFDIAGQNKANVEATVQAFLIACRMGASHRSSRVSRVAL